MKTCDKCLAWDRLQSGRLPHIFLIAFNSPDILGSLPSITLGLKTKQTNNSRQKVCVVGAGWMGA